MQWGGIAAIILYMGQKRLLRKLPTPGDFMICTAMCGSGVRTGLEVTPPLLLLTLLVPGQARTGLPAAVAGTTTLSAAGVRVVTATTRLPATPMSGSGSSAAQVTSKQGRQACWSEEARQAVESKRGTSGDGTDSRSIRCIVGAISGFF